MNNDHLVPKLHTFYNSWCAIANSRNEVQLSQWVTSTLERCRTSFNSLSIVYHSCKTYTSSSKLDFSCIFLSFHDIMPWLSITLYTDIIQWTCDLSLPFIFIKTFSSPVPWCCLQSVVQLHWRSHPWRMFLPLLIWLIWDMWGMHQFHWGSTGPLAEHSSLSSWQPATEYRGWQQRLQVQRAGVWDHLGT